MDSDWWHVEVYAKVAASERSQLASSYRGVLGTFLRTTIKSSKKHCPAEYSNSILASKGERDEKGK